MQQLNTRARLILHREGVKAVWTGHSKGTQGRLVLLTVYPEIYMLCDKTRYADAAVRHRSLYLR